MESRAAIWSLLSPFVVLPCLSSRHMGHNKHIFVTVAGMSKSKSLIDIDVLIPCQDREQRTENTGEGGQKLLEKNITEDKEY